MAAPLRITGLVRAANLIRRELTGPLTPERREKLRHRVDSSLSAVQRILSEHRASVGDLPIPSRRAYQFLANVKLPEASVDSKPGRVDDAPAPHRPTAAPPPANPQSTTIFSWPGLSAFVERLLDRLAGDLPDSEKSAVAESISRMSRRIELTLQRENASGNNLNPTTRNWRGWLAYFNEPQNLAAYIEARQRASRVITRAASGSRHYPPPLVIHFRPLSSIYKVRAGRGNTLLWLPTPMIAFDDAGFSDLATLIYHRGGKARHPVIERMTSDAFQTVRAEIESRSGLVDRAQGMVHDLSASFDRVNAAYFGGKMPRPRLTWNRTFTGRKFGHYDFVHDTVMVSRTLDAPGVPAFVVDFLMFHELLHKFHGLHWVNGRGYAHTSEFQQDERKFDRYVEAELRLEDLARAAR